MLDTAAVNAVERYLYLTSYEPEKSLLKLQEQILCQGGYDRRNGRVRAELEGLRPGYDHTLLSTLLPLPFVVDTCNRVGVLAAFLVASVSTTHQTSFEHLTSTLIDSYP